MIHTENKVLSIRWGTSRGRETYGYTTCSLSVDGRRVAGCNGGGYDMRGTVVGLWAASAFADRLRALSPDDMPENSHWEQAEKPSRYCENSRCGRSMIMTGEPAIPAGEVPRWIEHGEDQSLLNCAGCGQWTAPTQGEGRTVQDGRSFYGLTFHDPNYNPGRARIGEDVSDARLGGGPDGETVSQAEARGVSFGLERLRASYAASSKHSTDRHTVPSIDGACGMSSVETILRAIGIELRQIESTSKRDVYIVHDLREEGSAD